MNVMGPIVSGKIIKKSYGSISHLPGSKMINDADKLLGIQYIEMLTVRRKSVDDIVIITEKVDGMNSGVIRLDDKLYPIVRAGFDARTSKLDWIRAFAYFTDINSNRFMDVLRNGQRLCGE